MLYWFVLLLRFEKFSVLNECQRNRSPIRRPPFTILRQVDLSGFVKPYPTINVGAIEYNWRERLTANYVQQIQKKKNY